MFTSDCNPKMQSRWMDTKKAFGKALRVVRLARGLSQEALSEVSGRTYVSAVERGLKSPTLQKIDQLAQHLDIHPLTIVLLTYAMHDNRLDKAAIDTTMTRVAHEAQALLQDLNPETE